MPLSGTIHPGVNDEDRAVSVRSVQPEPTAAFHSPRLESRRSPPGPVKPRGSVAPTPPVHSTRGHSGRPMFIQCMTIRLPLADSHLPNHRCSILTTTPLLSSPPRLRMRGALTIAASGPNVASCPLASKSRGLTEAPRVIASRRRATRSPPPASARSGRAWQHHRRPQPTIPTAEPAGRPRHLSGCCAQVPPQRSRRPSSPRRRRADTPPRPPGLSGCPWPARSP